MKKIFLVCPSNIYYENKVFDLSNPLNRDNSWHPFFLLKKEFTKYGVELETVDCIQESDDNYGLIYQDFSNKVYSVDKNIKQYLLSFESELIEPRNWNLDNHKYFEKVFTWKDDIIDNKKYIKFNYAQEIPKKINKDLLKKEKLCTLIAGNKKNSHPLELYSKRVEAIRWFEKHHLDDFDLYGVGWDEVAYGDNKYINFMFSKAPFLKQFLASNYPSYCGTVESKNPVLEKYKFAICYENARDIPGYITEKIFDCFFAGCVPIYWGADNIAEHIPKECFIDKREFDSYEKLYDHIKNMSNEEYMRYLDSIEVFLNSEKIYQFSSDYFVDVLVKNIIKGSN